MSALYEDVPLPFGDDPPPAAVNRERAIQAVDEHAAPDWRQAARAAVERLAGALDTLTVDDVWAELERTDPDVRTHQPSAMGPVMRWAVTHGLLERTAVTVSTSRRPQHHGELRVYASRVRRRA